MQVRLKLAQGFEEEVETIKYLQTNERTERRQTKSAMKSLLQVTALMS